VKSHKMANGVRNLISQLMLICTFIRIIIKSISECNYARQMAANTLDSNMTNYNLRDGKEVLTLVVSPESIQTGGCYE